MKKSEMLKYAIRNIRYTRIRSWLTMVGIFIGIMAIIVLIGLANGLKNEINSELEKMGPNTIMIIPVDVSSAGIMYSQTAAFQATSGKLFKKDYEKIKKIPGIEYISKVVYGQANVEYKEQDAAISVYGVEPEVFKQTVGTLEIEKGKFLEENEYGVVVVGQDVAFDTYDKDMDLNSKLTIGNRSYKVVGILKKTGNAFFRVDGVIFTNFKNGEEIFEESLANEEINSIRISIEDGQNVDEIAEEITDTLLSLHKVSEEEKDFSVITASYINQRVGEITGLLTLFLTIVSGISLIVGGIGISNTMFMNVVERTREIGVLKAIGATKEEILNLFIIESSIFGIIGGATGIVFGAIVLFLINALVGISTSFSFEVSIIALIFSGAIGVLSGTLPARRASEVSPVEALRYE